ncbi:hypothetical protein AGOR_G00010060 [Albula goreensis]|uniref:TATA box-binding protein-associated factor RNA polymerase I subunit C n=1 Tax=Albula goreensis TaxID=1534307 RepID=A0A8T3E9D6_9TELE|nr:hypothetical protein AGOR_G00010060 [Albula goreensis]
MDENKFPHQLFPCFYNNGPPKGKYKISVDGWGHYGQAFEINHCSSEKGPGQLAEWNFDTQHKVKGETWKPVVPLAAPLLNPDNVCGDTSGYLPSATDFTEHMQNFYLGNYQDAFSAMSSALEEHFSFGEDKLEGSAGENTVNIWGMKTFLSNVNRVKCPLMYTGYGSRRYGNLLDDVIHDIPPVLLGELFHEELVLKRECAQFNEAATGGALGYFPVKISDNSQEGCLVFPGKASLSSLQFQKVVLTLENDKGLQLLKSKMQPLSIDLSGTIRQISVGSIQEDVYVAVRTDYQCGVWLANPSKRIAPLEVIQTEQMATCINVSPHIPGELVVTSENGAAYLWTVGEGLSKFREEEGNLYFNAQSSWRWCDFSAHPKVMQYADRTGVELTDTRSSNKCSYTLFRIGETANCKSGERVILSKYLSDVNSYHHLVTTQYSAFIMDERFPCLPMVKWEHMMEDPPLFAQGVAGSPKARNNKVLLGSQRSSELMLLQYSGGGESAYHSVGPPLKLLHPSETLRYLSVHIPHRQQHVKDRLGMPSAGFTAIHHSKAEECLCMLQLSEAGDIFYQILRPQTDQDAIDTPQPRTQTAENEQFPLPDPVAPSEWSDPLSQRLSVSWEGHWKSWWEDNLGMNRDRKVEALRRKRRQQKLARAHRRIGLAESFTSSVSFQSDLDYVSGWSSATSNYTETQSAWSDVDSVAGSSIPNDLPEPERTKVVTQNKESPVFPFTTLEKADSPPTCSRLVSRKINQTEQDYLSSLFGSQEPLDWGEDSGHPLIIAPLSQVSSISASQRNPSVVPSSQGSLSLRPRKRPRMGF